MRKISRNWKSTFKPKHPSPIYPTKHTQRDRERQKETERNRDTETERETQRGRDRGTNRDTEERQHEIPDLGIRGWCQVSYDDSGITLV